MLSSASKKVHYGKREIPTEPVNIKKEHNNLPKGLIFKLLICFFIIMIICASYYIGNLYTHVTVHVVPDAIKFNPNHKALIQEVASINIKNMSSKNFINVVPVNFEYTASRSIENLETEYISNKSTGSITIFNIGATSQLLTQGTRFINPVTKKIYFMQGDKIVLKGGTKAAPATAVVTIEAAEPGEEYNMKNETLKVFAWYDKQDPRNETQYAQPVTEIVGGFAGDKPLLSDTDKQTLTEELHKELSFVLKEKASSLSLSGVFKIDNPQSMSYEEPLVNTLLKVPKISIHGTYQIYLMKQRDWLDYAKRYSNFDIETIKNVQVIHNKETPFPEFSLITEADGQKIQQISSTIFYINPNEPLIKKVMMDKKIKHLGEILKDPELRVAAASISVQPFWLTKIPHDISKIEVNVK